MTPGKKDTAGLAGTDQASDLIESQPEDEVLDVPGVPELRQLSWGSTLRFQALTWKVRRLDGDPEALLAVWAEIHQEMGKVVISVPRAWLVEDAPESLDWKAPESYHWLRSDMMSVLLAYAAGDREKKAPRT